MARQDSTHTLRHPPLSPISITADAVVPDFDRLWRKAHTTAGEAEPVRTLAKILPLTDGRALILNLDSAELGVSGSSAYNHHCAIPGGGGLQFGGS
jgi:hypothetical protein